MSNSPEAAERWTRFLASRSYIPRAHLIQQHFSSGTLSRLCECGCESFDLKIAEEIVLEPLVPPSGRAGCALELDYYLAETAEPRRTVSFRIFVDARGYLAGIDADFQSNSSAMPEQVQLQEPPFHVNGSWLDI